MHDIPPPLSSDQIAYASHASMRHDTVSEQTVEVGIRLQDLLGTSDAAKFLKNNVIHIEVALRVLLHPERRRQNLDTSREP